jgi:hypothetical protein
MYLSHINSLDRSEIVNKGLFHHQAAQCLVYVHTYYVETKLKQLYYFNQLLWDSFHMSANVEQKCLRRSLQIESIDILFELTHWGDARKMVPIFLFFVLFWIAEVLIWFILHHEWWHCVRAAWCPSWHYMIDLLCPASYQKQIKVGRLHMFSPVVLFQSCMLQQWPPRRKNKITFSHYFRRITWHVMWAAVFLMMEWKKATRRVRLIDSLPRPGTTHVLWPFAQLSFLPLRLGGNIWPCGLQVGKREEEELNF